VGRLNFLPSLLMGLSKDLIKSLDSKRSEQDFKRTVAHLERLLQTYSVSFPYFYKTEAWPSFADDERSMDLWVLERLGWGKWKSRFRLLYVMEGIPVPQMEDAEVISVNSNSSPYLVGAQPLRLEQEVRAEEVQVLSLGEIPEALREKTLFCLPDFLAQLAATLSQMEVYNQEFDEFVETKIDEYLDKIGCLRGKKKSVAIEKYFRSDRRAELFFEFLEKKSKA